MTNISEKNPEKIAVILLNMGGPDNLKAVKPFLFNLFYDPAIISLKNPWRWLVAKMLSRKRAPLAREIYGALGGKSPLLDETEKQRSALQLILNQSSDQNHYQCFIAMRYWHPFSSETVEEVKKYQPDKVILLPLYPHYSITTTGSSLIDWDRQARKAGLEVPYAVIRDYPDLPGFVDGYVAMIRSALEKITNPEDYRILYSAHGLPEKIIESGDLYCERIKISCQAIQQQLGHPDHCLCYQGRVGPLKWIKPFVDDEIRRAGQDGKSVIVVPVSFVSEHSETLIELDVDYYELANNVGVTDYVRIAAIGCHPDFIEALSRTVMEKTTEMSLK